MFAEELFFIAEMEEAATTCKRNASEQKKEKKRGLDLHEENSSRKKALIGCELIVHVLEKPSLYVSMYSHTYSKSMDQPGKVANPPRGQLNWKIEYFPVRVRA